MPNAEAIRREYNVAWYRTDGRTDERTNERTHTHSLNSLTRSPVATTRRSRRVHAGASSRSRSSSVHAKNRVTARRRRRRTASLVATLRAGERKPAAVPSVASERASGRSARERESERANARAGWQVTLLCTGPGHAGQVHSRVPLACFPLYTPEQTSARARGRGCDRGG